MDTSVINVSSSAESPKTAHGPRPELIAFLRQNGAGEAPHGHQRSLLDHLQGVFHLLVQWQAETAVCEAGLFHSVYGTQQFRQATTRQRQPVIELIGQTAEAHVFAFAFLARRQFLLAAVAEDISRVVLFAGQRTAALPPEYWPGVSELLVANYLEHLSEPDAYRTSGNPADLLVLKPYLSKWAIQAIESVCQ